MINIISQLRQKKWAVIFIIYTRYLIGGAFVFSAIPKIAGERFTTANCETTDIGTWMHFFETLYRSGMYWEFLGWIQLIAGFILMTQLFSALGAIVFLPIILNVFVITISYQMTGTIVITGLMLLAGILLVLWDIHKISFLFIPERRTQTTIASLYDEYANHRYWAWLGLILFFTTAFYVMLNGRNPMMWFLICVIEGLVGLVVVNLKFRRNMLMGSSSSTLCSQVM